MIPHSSYTCNTNQQSRYLVFEGNPPLEFSQCCRPSKERDLSWRLCTPNTLPRKRISYFTAKGIVIQANFKSSTFVALLLLHMQQQSTIKIFSFQRLTTIRIFLMLSSKQRTHPFMAPLHPKLSAKEKNYLCYHKGHCTTSDLQIFHFCSIPRYLVITLIEGKYEYSRSKRLPIDSIS